MINEKIIFISADINMVMHTPIKMNGVVIISPEPIVFHPQPTDIITDDIINKTGTPMRIYDFDRIHLESKQHETDRRGRIHFQNIAARVQSKQIKQLNIKKQKGR